MATSNEILWINSSSKLWRYFDQFDEYKKNAEAIGGFVIVVELEIVFFLYVTAPTEKSGY